MLQPHEMERVGHLLADVGAGAVVVGHFILNGMPTIATALAIVWYAIQITGYVIKTRRSRIVGKIAGKGDTDNTSD